MAHSALPKHIHLIGIGGTGMSAIARVLLGRGHTVSGSDMRASKTTMALDQIGARVFIGHAAHHIEGAQVIVRSSAVPDSNPEVAAAFKTGVPVLKRSDFLGDLMIDQTGVAVAGTHGKTTTTGMIAHILMRTGLDPSIIVGADLPEIGVNGRAGMGSHFVIEADEYDRMFLGLRPTIGILTNVEHDHPDIFPTEASYLEAYQAFVDLIPASGLLIACGDDPGSRDIVPSQQQPSRILYGIELTHAQSNTAHLLQATDLQQSDLGGYRFTLRLDDQPISTVELSIPGRHNVLNAMAAIAATALDIPNGREHVSLSAAADALSSFTGMGRRFDIKGIVQGVTVIDDYAHHPTEIEATLQACRSRFMGQRIWAVWEPHTFSRTKLFLDRFRTAFHDADEVVVLDIYKSRETASLGMSAELVAEEIEHPSSRHGGSINQAVGFLRPQLEQGDVVIIMNAGDATRLSGLLIGELEKDSIG